MTETTAAPSITHMPVPFTRTSLPGRIVFGDGAVELLADELDRLDLRRAMLIVAGGRDAQLAECGRAVLREDTPLDDAVGHGRYVRRRLPSRSDRRS